MRHLATTSSTPDEFLKKAGVTAKGKKCLFGADHCVYLGHIVGGGEVRPEQGKLSAVAEFPIPSNKNDVLKFFCREVQRYRRFFSLLSQVLSSNYYLVAN